MDRLEKLCNLTPLKAEILLDVKRNEPTYASEVAERIDSRRQLVHKYMVEMESNNWIEVDRKVANATLYITAEVGQELAAVVEDFAQTSQTGDEVDE